MVTIGSAGVLAPGKWRWLRALGWLAALCVAIVAAYNAVAKAALWLMASSCQTPQSSGLTSEPLAESR